MERKKQLMNHRHCSCCENGHMPGIVSANSQQTTHIYPAQRAIRYGTLYPELNKPLAWAAAPTGCAEPTRSQTNAFSAWEVRLYLNTHPEDEAAMQLYRQICQQTPQPNYACTFVHCGDRWNWIDDPWPWECAANEGRA